MSIVIRISIRNSIRITNLTIGINIAISIRITNPINNRPGIGITTCMAISGSIRIG